jgi:hypothetical protein
VVSAEDFIDQAVATLISRLDAQIAAQQAKYAGGPHDIGPLARPRYAEAPDGDFYPGGVAEVIRWPTIEVALPDARGENPSLEQHDYDVQTRAMVRAHVSDVKAQYGRLHRLALRWGAAIHDTLMPPDPVLLRGSGFGADVAVKTWRMAVRNANLETEEGAPPEVQTSILLVYDLDVPDIRP